MKKNEKLAQAFVRIDNELLDMGDCYRETLEGICEECHINLDDIMNEDGDILDDDQVALKVYEQAIMQAPEKLAARAGYLFDKEYIYMDTLMRNIPYCRVDDIAEHPTYKALKEIGDFLSPYDKKSANRAVWRLNDFRRLDLNAMNLGFAVGHRYYSYLDNSVFGMITNSCFTVGDVILPYEAKSYEAEYGYVFHKDFNLLGLNHYADHGLAVFVRSDPGSGKDMVLFSINEFTKKYSTGFARYTYGEEKTSICVPYADAMENVDELAKKIAGEINAQGAMIRCRLEQKQCTLKKAYSYDEIINTKCESEGARTVISELLDEKVFTVSELKNALHFEKEDIEYVLNTMKEKESETYYDGLQGI